MKPHDDQRLTHEDDCPENARAAGRPVDNCPGCENQDGFTSHNHPLCCPDCSTCCSCDPCCVHAGRAVPPDTDPVYGPCAKCGRDHVTEDHEEGTACLHTEPNHIGECDRCGTQLTDDHEHSAGCWPGGEGEFDCPVIKALRALRASLKECADYIANPDKYLPGAVVDVVNAADEAIEQAEKVIE